MSDTIKISLDCVFCDNSRKATIKCEGWKIRYGEENIEDALCPKHSVIEDFFESQCPGCVAGWPKCGLGEAFRYCDHKPVDLTDSDRAKIQSGHCPKRVNGSFSFSREEGMTALDLSDPAPIASAEALLRAIDEYVAKYANRRSGGGRGEG